MKGGNIHTYMMNNVNTELFSKVHYQIYRETNTVSCRLSVHMYLSDIKLRFLFLNNQLELVG